jgi:hypothetical protein
MDRYRHLARTGYQSPTSSIHLSSSNFTASHYLSYCVVSLHCRVQYRLTLGKLSSTSPVLSSIVFGSASPGRKTALISTVTILILKIFACLGSKERDSFSPLLCGLRGRNLVWALSFTWRELRKRSTGQSHSSSPREVHQRYTVYRLLYHMHRFISSGCRGRTPLLGCSTLNSERECDSSIFNVHLHNRWPGGLISYQLNILSFRISDILRLWEYCLNDFTDVFSPSITEHYQFIQESL